MPQLTEEKARELFGDPRETRRRLERFSVSAQALSSDRVRLIEAYPDQWVAIHEGCVKAHAADLDELIEAVEQAGIRRDEVIVRFIERNQRALIL